MRLGELIDALGHEEPKAQVRFDFGTPPDRLASWRGVYAQLTLTHGTKPVTVSTLLADAQRAVGRSFEGYKGGRYRMDEETPVWADDYGDWDERCILALDRDDGAVIIRTALIGEYT